MRTRHLRAWHYLFAVSALLGTGGGCIAIYSFDDFDKKAPITCTADKECESTETGKDDKACGLPTCANGTCTRTNLVDEGTLSRNHVIGDCQRRYCDGKGNEVVELDPKNVRSDGAACTEDVCIDNKPENILADVGTACGATGTMLKCDAMGVCRGCTAPSECGVTSACADWACEGGACVKLLQPIGTEVANTTPGDCRKNLCNSTGESPDTFAADDAPDDGNPCTLDYCTIEYEIKHDNIAGTKCGDCKVCNADGICGACDGATSDCYNGECVPKPKTCMLASDCTSTYCVDGYCCDSECTGKCMACNATKTGVMSGICAPIPNGTDPDGECKTLPGDSCFNGDCGCSNGVQDNGELGIDCGPVCNNVCSGKWNCGTQEICAGDNATQVCCPAFIGCNATSCPNQAPACTKLHNVGCTLGEASQKFVVGSVGDISCVLGGFAACRTVTCVCQ